MFHMPMSSPMMTRMLGFLSCAKAGCANDSPMIAPMMIAPARYLRPRECISAPLLSSLSLTLPNVPCICGQLLTRERGHLACDPDNAMMHRQHLRISYKTCDTRRPRHEVHGGR